MATITTYVDTVLSSFEDLTVTEKGIADEDISDKASADETPAHKLTTDMSAVDKSTLELAQRVWDLPRELFDIIKSYTFVVPTDQIIPTTKHLKPPPVTQVSRETRRPLIRQYYNDNIFLPCVWSSSHARLLQKWISSVPFRLSNLHARFSVRWWLDREKCEAIENILHRIRRKAPLGVFSTHANVGVWGVTKEDYALIEGILDPRADEKLLLDIRHCNHSLKEEEEGLMCLCRWESGSLCRRNVGRGCLCRAYQDLRIMLYLTPRRTMLDYFLEFSHVPRPLATTGVPGRNVQASSTT